MCGGLAPGHITSHLWSRHHGDAVFRAPGPDACNLLTHCSYCVEEENPGGGQQETRSEAGKVQKEGEKEDLFFSVIR